MPPNAPEPARRFRTPRPRQRRLSPFFACACALLIGCIVAVTPKRASAANDPTLLWKSIETEHFRISYYSGEEEVAKHIADLAEGIHARLTPVLGWEPRERTEIVLTDQTDSANGSATALPFNLVRIFLTAPADLSPLGDVDDWYLELLTHEYTHILHADQMRGLPTFLNAIFGKTFAPNQAQPSWILEGLAVLEESVQTSGGRLRSSQWNMYMRADVLEGNVATLDQFSNTPRRWPQGNLWYLYGSFFMRFIAETYGEEAIRKIIADYGTRIIPYGLNRSVRRATGRTYEELYPAFIGALRKEFEAQAAQIRARGIREGVRLTTTGQTVRHPRFVPNGAFPGADIVFFRDDAHSLGGLYGLKLARAEDGSARAEAGTKPELIARTNGDSTASFTPDGRLVFNSGDITKNLFFFGDLFSMPKGETSETGLEGNRTRLTEGFRTAAVDVSPDGRRIVFTTNHRGTTRLHIARLEGDHIEDVRTLVSYRSFDQAYTPRWSPDNRHVAYSAWTRGGYRDVRIVDTTDGSFRAVTRDRATDGGPVFSQDGRWLLFHSDRTGVMNIYAYELESGALKQVTNVVNGAFQPVLSPDGKTLVYVGYTHRGFDLFAMAFDPSQFLEALPYESDRPDEPTTARSDSYTIKPYNPLYTLRPRNYSLQITPGNFGQAVIVSVTGRDIAAFHGFAASLRVEVENPSPQVDVNYVYGRMPVDMGLRAYRTLIPRGGYQLGQEFRPPWVQETVGAESNVVVPRPRAFDGQTFALSYGFANVTGDFTRPESRLDPYETPVYPNLNLLGTLSVGWSYSNAQRFLWSIGAERGFSVGANLTLTDPWLGSEFRGFATSFDVNSYWLMPWFRHHSLALHAGAGTSAGTLPGRGVFFVGGLVDLPVIDAVRNVLIQGGIALRGYPVVALAGRNYALFNAEYRFPIVNIDRGLSTLPIFLNRINGNLFVDYGSAFDDAETAKFKTGVGGELWFDFQLAYQIGFTFRLGYARGLASGGIDKTYFVASVPF